VTVGGNRTLTVEASGNGPATPYIQAVRWNGRPWTKSWIDHATLSKGGTLSFTMGAQPNPAFGRDPKDRPPSFDRQPA
jgi:putative alpha-1,2-mannosidase